MTEFTTKSGAKVVIKSAPFLAANTLWRALMSASLQRKISLGNDLPFLIMALGDSQEFTDAIWPCLIKCTRNDKKIEESTFENEEVRGEYYEIITACAEKNIRPFYDGLSSGLETRLAEIKKAPPGDDPASS